jgi:hypothetical protein
MILIKAAWLYFLDSVGVSIAQTKERITRPFRKGK